MKYELRSIGTEAVFLLTFAEINLLMALSALHYDAKCKGAGRVGGFVYGWNNMAAFDKSQGRERVEICATFRDLDCCLKIMEHPIDKYKARAMKLRAKFWALCDAMQVFYADLPTRAGEV